MNIFFLSVVTENMNNTNEINILTNQACPHIPKTPALSWEESRVQGCKKLSQKEKDKEGRGGDLTLRAISRTNNIKVYNSLGLNMRKLAREPQKYIRTYKTFTRKTRK